MIVSWSEIGEADITFKVNVVLAAAALVLTAIEVPLQSVAAEAQRKEPGAAAAINAERRASLATRVLRGVLISLLLSAALSINSIRHTMTRRDQMKFIVGADEVYSSLADDVRHANGESLTTHIRNADVNLKTGKEYQAALQEWIKNHPEKPVRRLITAHSNYVKSAQSILAASKLYPNLEVRGIDWPLETPMNNIVIFDAKIVYVVTYGTDPDNPLSQYLRAIRVEDAETASSFREYFELLWQDRGIKDQEVLYKFYNIPAVQTAP